LSWLGRLTLASVPICSSHFGTTPAADAGPNTTKAAIAMRLKQRFFMELSYREDLWVL
jgi:hypothetical protein